MISGLLLEKKAVIDSTVLSEFCSSDFESGIANASAPLNFFLVLFGCFVLTSSLSVSQLGVSTLLLKTFLKSKLFV